MNKRDASILMGNALDRFDTSLYGFLAPVLGPFFFPQYDTTVQLILTYATSAVSLFSRPLGAFLFGMCARNYGPVVSLSYSLIGVAIMTVLIGCTPGYAVIGWVAPLLLVCVRFMRGICAAGESTVAKLYIMEGKTDHHALRASYWYQSSSMFGIVMASAVATVVIGMQPELWRICFWAGGLTGCAAYYMRTCGADKKEDPHQLLYAGYTYASLSLLWSNKSNVLRVAIVTIFSHMTYAVPFVFMNSFVPLITDITLQTMMMLNTSLLFFDMLAVPIMGRFSERYNARHIMISASMVLGFSIVPLFYCLPTAPLWYVTFVRLWIVFWGVLFLCPLNFWCKSLFSSSDQYFLVGMGNALGTATLGHMTTPICLWLWYVTGFAWMPAVYMALVMGLAMYVIVTAGDGK